MNHKYNIKAKDPDGKTRRFTVYENVPVQRFSRGVWEVTITKIKRNGFLRIDKVVWEKE